MEPIWHSVRDATLATFVYQGRAERLEHWAFLLFTSVVVLVFQLLAKFGLVTIFPINWIFLAVFVWLLLANVSLMVRRLHDHDLSGFWMFVPLFPLAIMLLAAKAIYGNGSTILTREGAETLFLLSQGAMVTVLIVFGSLFARPGDKKPNRFGPAP